VVEDFDRKFRAAWDVFSQTCSLSVAPEATYQVWFAHYLITQFGIDRVAREVGFKHKYFDSEYRHRLVGAEARLDAVVTRVPGIDFPHYILRSDAPHGGLETVIARVPGCGRYWTQDASQCLACSFWGFDAMKAGLGPSVSHGTISSPSTNLRFTFEAAKSLRSR
jgi:hypothetical protein